MPAALLVAILLLLSTLGARAEHRLPPVHLVIDIRNSGVTTASVVAAALNEVSEIWAPYGVRVTGSSRVRRDGRDHEIPVVRATLELAEADARLDPRMTPLGFTPFSTDGQPLTTIAIFYDAVVRTVSESALFGQREVESSSILRERLLARILGRTMAHELGHLLLETPAHSDSGLMRAFQSATDLAHPDRTGFALEAGNLARLRVVQNRPFPSRD